MHETDGAAHRARPRLQPFAQPKAWTFTPLNQRTTQYSLTCVKMPVKPHVLGRPWHQSLLPELLSSAPVGREVQQLHLNTLVAMADEHGNAGLVLQRISCK